MRLHAIFESWLLADGEYPSLTVGGIESFAFQVELIQPLRSTLARPSLSVRSDAECSFVGEVLEIAATSDPPIIVVDSGSLRFCVEGDPIRQPAVGQMVEGGGFLLVDHLGWSTDGASPTTITRRPFQVHMIWSARVADYVDWSAGRAVKVPKETVRTLSKTPAMELAVKAGDLFVIDLDPVDTPALPG